MRLTELVASFSAPAVSSILTVSECPLYEAQRRGDSPYCIEITNRY